MGKQNIPEDLHTVIVSMDTFEKFKTLWSTYNITDEQKPLLGTEAGKYMSGQTKEARFVPDLMYALDINRQSAEGIKEFIDTELLTSVWSSFQQVQKGEELSSAGIEIEKNTEDTEQNISTDTETKKDILEDVENPMHTEPRVGIDTENSNYEPLQVIKEDVMKGIEDPVENEEVEISQEGTDLDRELDQILRKPRTVPEPPDNLPTETRSSIGQEKTVLPKAAERNPTPTKKTTSPAPVEYTSGDPYREPIE